MTRDGGEEERVEALAGGPSKIFYSGMGALQFPLLSVVRASLVEVEAATGGMHGKECTAWPALKKLKLSTVLSINQENTSPCKAYFSKRAFEKGAWSPNADASEDLAAFRGAADLGIPGPAWLRLERFRLPK